MQVSGGSLEAEGSREGKRPPENYRVAGKELEAGLISERGKCLQAARSCSLGEPCDKWRSWQTKLPLYREEGDQLRRWFSHQRTPQSDQRWVN